MSIKNRELSQFGSFIYIDDSTKTVGIATTATPYVGIGTTNASSKLTVIGNANISGNTVVGGAVSATSFYLNGSSLVNAALQTWELSGSDIYRLDGNVGIGTSVFSAKLTVSGNVSASRFISTVTTGTSPFTVTSQTLVTNLNSDYLRGKAPPSGDIVGTTDSQTLANKSLTLPTFNGTGVRFSGSTSGFTTVRSTAVSFGIIEIPSVIGIQTFITTGSVGLVTSGMIADLSIVNADIAVGAAITYGKLSLSNSIVNSDIAAGAGITYGKLSLSNSITNADIAVGAGITNGKLANSTISGISLGSNLNNLTLGSYVTFDAGTTYNGSTARTISVNATSSDTPSTIIARDSSRGFNAGSLSVTSTGTNINGNVLVSGITTIGLATTSFPANSQMSFDLTTNTNLRINVKGSDSILRSVNITLSQSGDLITASQDELGLFW